jgi:hypothetical protein
MNKNPQRNIWFNVNMNKNPQRNIWFNVNMNKNTQALREALVFALEKIGRKDIIKVERTAVRSS